MQQLLHFVNKMPLDDAAFKAILLLESHHCIDCKKSSSPISASGYLSGCESKFGFFKKIVICKECLKFVERKYKFFKFKYEYLTNYS